MENNDIADRQKNALNFLSFDEAFFKRMGHISYLGSKKVLTLQNKGNGDIEGHLHTHYHIH